MTFTATPRNEATINGFGAAVASSALPATLANSLIVVVLTDQLPSGTSGSIADNLGNTYKLVPLTNPGVSQRHGEIWWTQSPAAGVTGVIVNNGSSVNVAGSVTEWPSSLPVTVRDQASLANAASANPPAALAAALAKDLIISMLAYQATEASIQQEFLADPANWITLTRQTRGTTSMFAAAYRRAATDGPAGPSWMMKKSDGTAVAVATGEVTGVFTQAPVFTASTAGLSAAFDASGSTVPGGDTITDYSWNFGDSIIGAGVSPSHAYATAGTYQVTLTVTYSTGSSASSTRPVTVSNPTTSANPVAVVSAVGWTVTGASGNAVTATADPDPATYVVSPPSPSGSLFRERLGALMTPAAGTDMIVQVEADAIGGNGTLSAKLYEGSTVRAVAAAQALTVATAGSNTAATLTFTFPASSIANVTNWNALELEVAATAA